MLATGSYCEAVDLVTIFCSGVNGGLISYQINPNCAPRYEPHITGSRSCQNRRKPSFLQDHGFVRALQQHLLGIPLLGTSRSFSPFDLMLYKSGATEKPGMNGREHKLEKPSNNNLKYGQLTLQKNAADPLILSVLLNPCIFCITPCILLLGC